MRNASKDALRKEQNYDGVEFPLCVYDKKNFEQDFEV